MSAETNAINIEDNKEQIMQAVIDKYKNMPGSLRNIINEARDIYGDIPAKVQGKITAALGLPITKIFSVVSFSDSPKLIKEVEYINKLTEGIIVLKSENNVLLKNIGIVDPKKMEDYLQCDGYKALESVLTEIEPEDITKIIKDSGLRGRSGQGKSTGQKWEVIRSMPDQVKYICCYAEESDLSGVKDRFLIENSPYAVLEAMTIAGYAVGAQQGFIYINSKWKTAAKNLKNAIENAREKGLLGNGIQGTTFNFDIDIRFSNNDFIKGEVTSLLAALEGNRGEPSPKQLADEVPRLWQKPVLVNNVETLLNVPSIIRGKTENPLKDDSEYSNETKVMLLIGANNLPVIVEVPLGMSLKELIYGIGGGIPNDKKLKAVLVGGIMGTCVPESNLEYQINYKTAKQTGLPLVSGGFIVMDEDVSLVDMAKVSMELISNMSCGKCPTCRIGTKRMFEILSNIAEGIRKKDDLEKIKILAKSIKLSTCCSFGYNAPDFVLSAIEHLPGEFMENILNDEF